MGRSGEVEGPHFGPRERLLCEEQWGQGLLEEGAQALRLGAVEKMKRPIHFLAELTLCRGGEFEFLQLLCVGEQVIAEFNWSQLKAFTSVCVSMCVCKLVTRVQV